MEAATLEAPVVMEAPAATSPMVAELLDQHLDHKTQKQIAVQNLNSIKFLIAPDGKSAVSSEELKSPAHRQIVEESLKAVLGERMDNTPYLPAPQGVEGMLGLTSGNNFVQIHAPAHIQMLAEAGVKDFAEALGVSHTSHAAKVR